jgi:hypothetical protein
MDSQQCRTDKIRRCGCGKSYEENKAAMTAFPQYQKEIL